MSIEKMFVVSTGHVSESDMYKLESDIVAGDTIGMSRDFGCLVYIGDSVSAFIEAEYQSLAQVVDEAKKNSCMWLMLDCDGNLYDDLPSYDW